MNNSFIEVLKLHFKAKTLKDRNTAVILISEYITGFWHGCKAGLSVDDPRLVAFIRQRIIRGRWIIYKMLNDDMNGKFTVKKDTFNMNKS